MQNIWVQCIVYKVCLALMPIPFASVNSFPWSDYEQVKTNMFVPVKRVIYCLNKWLGYLGIELLI